MSNVIKFPKTKRPIEATRKRQAVGAVAPLTMTSHRRVIEIGIGFVWIMTLLIWPFLKFAVTADVLYQFARMLYHWRTPGMHAGWVFVMHFAVLTALTYFVGVYRPKGM